MEIAELVLKYVEALAWPLVTLVLVYGLRAHIRGAFGRLTRLETPAGSLEFAAEVRELRDEAAGLSATRAPDGLPGGTSDEEPGHRPGADPFPQSGREWAPWPEPAAERRHEPVPEAAHRAEPEPGPEAEPEAEADAEWEPGPEAPSGAAGQAHPAERLPPSWGTVPPPATGGARPGGSSHRLSRWWPRGTDGHSTEARFGEARAMAAASPVGAVITAWTTLESLSADVLRQRSLPVSRRVAGPYDVRQVMAGLRELGVSDDAEAVFDRLRRLRNTAVHHPGSVSVEAAEDFVAASRTLAQDIQALGPPPLPIP
ncbi:hypothetical protein [Streptomyces sp. B1I3]|uniref:hypothetical protein n=1 Tax=Streptomyces sp. B1I3 TaxID=3042264 RepID=UPI0027804E14|nr:hypothetical protein [Streptomyces sp. B1I3]MDQ0796193.1 hypothetical protein [Streptomyces sp. B1I3]